MIIVAGIATIPSREQYLKKAVRSLLPQVDRINIALNGFDYVPEWLCNDKIQCHLTTNEKGDANKFHKVEGDMFLSCDDDIAYPRNYAIQCKRNLAKYPGQVITYHGRNILKFPVASYYRAGKVAYHCRHEVAEDVAVQFGGTGVMAFMVKDFYPKPEDFPTANMADIHVAIATKRQNIRIICCKHSAGWFKVQDVPNTIYDQHNKADEVQTDYVNRVWLNLP